MKEYWDIKKKAPKENSNEHKMITCFFFKKKTFTKEREKERLPGYKKTSPKREPH